MKSSVIFGGSSVKAPPKVDLKGISEDALDTTASLVKAPSTDFREIDVYSAAQALIRYLYLHQYSYT